LHKDMKIYLRLKRNQNA